MDVLGLVIACPRFLVDMFVLFLEYARWTPTLGKSIVNGDAATLKMMTDFCVYASSIIFVVYAALTALNLSLQLAVGVKDYFASWMVLPTKPLGFTLPKALMDVRNWIQEHMINPIIRLKCGSWIVPLEGQSGAPSLKAATSVLASACSACMILACAPSAQTLSATALRPNMSFDQIRGVSRPCRRSGCSRPHGQRCGQGQGRGARVHGRHGPRHAIPRQDRGLSDRTGDRRIPTRIMQHAGRMCTCMSMSM